MVNVLYEDNHLLAVEKPPNMPVQADSSGDGDLLGLLKGYIKEKYHKPGEAYLGLVHRLDRPVGGVMVFARTSKAAARLSEQFRGGRAEKNYLGVIQGRAPGGTLTDWLVRDAQSGSSRRAEEGEPGAKTAKLSYKALAYKNGLTLAGIKLYTGRHHQIRVQLAGRGLPLWGDQRYNGEAKAGQQIALWACSLKIEHPTKHGILTFTSLPRGGVWDGFAQIVPGAAAGIPIAYIDGDIIAADKPAGLPTAAGDGDGESLETALSRLYGPVYPAHRLDANTTGLVLLARNERALKALEEAIAERRIRKFYRCTVKGRPPRDRDELAAYWEKDAGRALVGVYDKNAPGRKAIATRYRVVSTEGDTSELEAEPVTGRTHQIRAHLAHIGCPILGDDKYGDREFNRRHRAKTQALRAVRLELHFGGGYLARLDGREIRLDEI